MTHHFILLTTPLHHPTLSPKVMDQTAATAPGAFDVFLSHNSKDKPAVRHLKQQLSNAGLRVWLDEDELRPGIPWQQLLEAGIRASRSIAVLVGADGLGPWEDEEMQAALVLAVKDKRPVIPVLLPGAPAQPDLPLFLTNRTWVDLRPGSGQALDNLIWGITGQKPGQHAGTTPHSPLKPVERSEIPTGRDTLHSALLHTLTPPVPDFTGRDADLDELRRKVKQGGVAITGLRGMGGAGKTELARKLAAELKPDYPDAQIELNLKGVDPQPLSPEEVLASILRPFHPAAKLPDRVEEVAALLRHTLDGKRVLLLLDNAKDAHQVKPLLPPPPGCLVLVTSRRHFALPGLEAVDLGTMDPPEARALLLKIAPRVGDVRCSSLSSPATTARPAVAERERGRQHGESGGEGQGEEVPSSTCSIADPLAEACGRLPLALRLAASLLAERPHIAPADYLRQLRESRQRLKLLDEAREDTDVEPGLEASFNLSFQQLAPGLQTRFTQLAVFPASFDRPAAQAVWAPVRTRSTASLVSDTLNTLVRLSLLEWNDKSQRFELHDLLRDFARSRAKPGDLAVAGLRHAKHFIQVGEQADTLYHKGSESVLNGLALFDCERPHIEAAFDWLNSSLDKESAPLLVSLVDAVTFTSSLRLHPRQLIRWLEAEAKAASLAGNRRYESSALSNLGLAYAALRDAHKAIDLYEQALAITRQIRDRLAEGNVLGNLGLAYASLGDARKASGLYERQLAIARELGDRRGEGNALLNLGVACANLGELHKAIELYGQSLAIFQGTGDWRCEGNALGNLGNLYAALGDHPKAVELHRRALAIAREVGDRRGEGAALGNLAKAHLESGDARQAIGLYGEALAIDREVGDRRGEGNALANAANAYCSLRDPGNAIKSYEQALAIYREIGDRRGEGAVLGNLGNAYTNLGEARKAIELYEERLLIAREIGDRLGEGYGLWNSALLVDKLRNRTDAIARAEAALEIFEAVGTPEVAKVRAPLAEWRKTG